MFSLEFAVNHFPQMLKAVPLTLFIAVFSMLLGLVFGFLLALCRIYKVPVLNQLAAVYVSFIRGTPILVQIYILFYGTPLLVDYLNKELAWNFSADTIHPLGYALTSYTLYTSAYQSEIIRAGLSAIDFGQLEAAYSVGMTTPQALMRIILPQALAVTLPNLGNTFIGLIKGSSLAFAVKVVEIMAVAKIVATDGYRFVEMYFDAALIYWVLCLVFEQLFAKFEKYLRRYETEMADSLSS